ncbi:Uncharacterized protein FWK35_00006600 [Aphis craccivora]|uniref:Uncharacterized protein n=2 Tax=Aphis craccivora TaxID=307492 RepID=A0A6G0YW61_APHCR|nr:Uncharacterized protein FWK35_00006600 [Aphis craccivora]
MMGTLEVESEIVKTTKKGNGILLAESKEIEDNSNNVEIDSLMKDDVIVAIESLSIVDTLPENVYGNNSSTSDEIIHETKNEVSSIEENQIVTATIKDPKTITKQIIILNNKYGEYNLNMKSSEFTLERYTGNLIISYELFHKHEPELAQFKLLEIQDWLENLDKGTDEFYLSINTGLRHVVNATFIHMLYVTNLTEECKWTSVSYSGRTNWLQIQSYFERSQNIISMDPKDPLLVVKCARILMTYPNMVRDFDLGKQCLMKASELALNDETILKAISEAEKAYNNNTKPKTSINKLKEPPSRIERSKLIMDLEFIKIKHMYGEDHVPYLINLDSKYDGLEQSKILAQLCSYLILYTNNLKLGIDQFIKLIEQPGIPNNTIITVNSERSEECIDFTMIITSRNNAPISNYGGGFRCKSEYPWCIIEVKS